MDELIDPLLALVHNTRKFIAERVDASGERTFSKVTPCVLDGMLLETEALPRTVQLLRGVFVLILSLTTLYVYREK